MKRVWLPFLALIMVILTLLTLTVTTQTGLKLTVRALNYFHIVEIDSEQLNGRLLGTMTAKKIMIGTGGNQWRAEEFEITFNPIPLLWHHISITNIAMKSLSNKPLTKQVHKNQAGSSPEFTFSIRSANIQSLKLRLHDRLEKIEIQNITWTGKVDHDQVQFNFSSGSGRGLFQSITASVSGPLSHYQINTKLIRNNMTVTGTGSGKGKSFNLLLLSQSTSNSSLTGTASVKWENDFIWNMTLQAQKISLHQFIKNAPYIHSLNSTVSGQKGKTLSKLNWQVDLKTNKGDLQSQGSYLPNQVAANWNLKNIQLQAWNTAASGTLTSNGSWKNGATTGSLNLSDANWAGWTANKLNATWKGSPKQYRITNLLAHTEGLSYQGKTIKNGKLAIQEDKQQQQPFQLSLQFSPGVYDTESIALAGVVQKKENDYGIQLKQATVQSLGETWKSKKPFSLNYTLKNWSLTPACLLHQQQFICGSFHSNTGGWQASVQSKHAPLHHAMKSVKIKLPTDLNLTLHQKTNGPLLGKVQTSVDNAKLMLTEHSIETPVYLKDSSLKADILENKIIFSSSSHWNKHKLWDISGEITRPSFTQPKWDDSEIDASLYFDAKDLNFMNSFMEDTELHSGTITGKTSIKGTLSAPRVKGQIDFNKIELQLVPLKNQLNNLHGSIHFFGKKADLQLTASTASSPVALLGNAEFDQLKKLRAHFNLNSQGATLINTKDYLGIGDLDLQGSYFANTFALSGQALISKATIKPAHFSSATTLSDDVNILGENKLSPWQPTANVLIKLGRNVRIDSQRLSGQLTGEVRLLKNEESPWLGQGQIFMKNGKVNDLDLNLKVANDSHVAYDKDPLNSPFVSLKLYRVISSHGFGLNNLANINDLTVGLAMIGPYHNLEVKPYSQPTQLSQADILSYLLLGHPSNNSSAFNLASLLATAGSLSSDNIGTGLVQLMSIKKTLGFTELGVQSNLTLDALGTPYGTDESGFVVGRYITPRIYVRYISGISTLLNLLQIQYFMGHKWSLQLESGSVSSTDVEGIDLLYHFTSLLDDN